jgi:hypothetical protein
MAATVILSPIANRTFVTSTGAVYIADNYGLIVSTTISKQETDDLKAAGCSVLTPPPTDLIGTLKSANFNSAADQAVNLLINAKYRVTKITALNTSVNGMSTAVGGVYTAASKGGSALVANTQAYTGLTNALTALDLTLALPNLILAAGTPLYLSLTTAQGAAATVDLAVFGQVFTF